MEITGWDTVVFTATPPREVFTHILAVTATRWPGAILEGLVHSPTRQVPVATFPPEQIPKVEGHLIFYRDDAMARHMEEAAYTPMADGDGPFAVITRIRRGVEYELSGLNEVRTADRPIGVPDPYGAWLCAPELVEVTAVTPADPTSHSFSAWVLTEVKRACSKSAEWAATPDPSV